MAVKVVSISIAFLSSYVYFFPSPSYEKTGQYGPQTGFYMFGVNLNLIGINQEGIIEELTRFLQCLNEKTGFDNF